jgi:hypothetical protein
LSRKIWNLEEKISQLAQYSKNTENFDKIFHETVIKAKRENTNLQLDSMLENMIRGLKLQGYGTEYIMVFSFPEGHNLRMTAVPELFFKELLKNQGDELYHKMSQLGSQVLPYEELVKRVNLLKKLVSSGEIKIGPLYSLENILIELMDHESSLYKKIGAHPWSPPDPADDIKSALENISSSAEHHIKQTVEKAKKRREESEKRQEKYHEKIDSELEKLGKILE